MDFTEGEYAALKRLAAREIEREAASELADRIIRRGWYAGHDSYLCSPLDFWRIARATDARVEVADEDDVLAGCNFIRIHTLNGTRRLAPDPNCLPLEDTP